MELLIRVPWESVTAVTARRAKRLVVCDPLFLFPPSTPKKPTKKKVSQFFFDFGISIVPRHRSFVFGSHVSHQLHRQFFHLFQVLRLLRPEHEAHSIVRNLHNKLPIRVSVFRDAPTLQRIRQIQFLGGASEFVPSRDVRHF